jgi:hypothetical protein
MDDGAVARYEGLLASVQHRLAQHFQLNANFTDSYCLSDYDFGAALAASTNSQVFNRHADWGPCVFDTRYNFNTSLEAQSWWSGSNPWANRLLSNWKIAPLIHISSGQPLLLNYGSSGAGTDFSRTGLGNDRPNQIKFSRTLMPLTTHAAIPAYVCNSSTQRLSPHRYRSAVMET